MTQKLVMYLTTTEFNNLAADAFNARLAQIVTKKDFYAKLLSLTEKLRQINQNTYLFKMS